MSQAEGRVQLHVNVHIDTHLKISHKHACMHVLCGVEAGPRACGGRGAWPTGWVALAGQALALAAGCLAPARGLPAAAEGNQGQRVRKQGQKRDGSRLLGRGSPIRSASRVKREMGADCCDAAAQSAAPAGSQRRRERMWIQREEERLRRAGRQDALHWLDA